VTAGNARPPHDVLSFMESRHREFIWPMAAAAVLVGLAACGSNPTGTGPTPVATPSPTPTPAAATARYRITFEATWSAASHPDAFPASPHFSPLVGATHSSTAVFWEPGRTATAGIEAMAEEGSTSPLDTEVQAAIAAGAAEGLIRGEGLSRSPGTTSVEFQIGRDHPLVTLVAMVAPSPDWFVGVHGLSLVENGDWVSEKTVTLAPYDAGTDSGLSYLSPNADTMPREPVRRIEGAPLASGGTVAPMGIFTFVRIPG
jgi:hypothetical protein